MASADVITGLHALGLRASRETLDALLTHATKSRLGPVEVCEQLVALERREREARNLVRRTRTATLGQVPPLDRFDWNHPRQIDRPLYEQLLHLEFLAQGQNILFRGQSGVGKTTLAKNLGLAALRAGKTVRFATLASAMADLLKQESLPALERRLKRYTQPTLLVLDEVGYLPCESKAADLLYHIVSRRHENRSIVITTNLSFKLWATLFPGASCLGALIDRFVQHCHVLDIDADSWRHKHALQRSKKGQREMDLLPPL